ncbi:hypothetical protein GOODEAATRI_016827 [Goodea atripinnis]|uniref:Uncharacterized protein n=1 Tax=Goodea atripinnis TaxID=208336 RepID=A0ABV0P4S4_9TELE
MTLNLSRCVLGQETSPPSPILLMEYSVGLDDLVVPMYGSLNSVSLPQGSCGYIVVYHCQFVNVCINGWMTDCSVKHLGSLLLDKVLYKCRCIYHTSAFTI